MATLAVASPAGAAVREVEFSWSSEDGVRLAGELVLPAAGGPHPAVVMLHGSGPRTREDFRRQARFLADRGLAALIFDKRGSGESGGDGYRYAQLEADTHAAVEALDRRPDIRRRAIALWGVSEGAFVCPRVAAENPKVGAVVIVGGSAIAPTRQQDWAVRNGLLVEGAGDVATRPATTFYRLVADVDSDFRFEPGPSWRRVAQPVLAIWGGDDRLIPIRESAAALRAHLQAAPNTDRTFRTFAGANHGLVVGVRGRNAIYAPRFLELTAGWLRQRLTGATRRHIDTPLPKDNGVTASRAIERPAWHGTLAAQITWVTLLLLTALLAVGLRSGIPTRTPIALDVLAALSLAAGIVFIDAETGLDIPMLGGYPLPLWPAVVLTTASAGFTIRLVLGHAGDISSPRHGITFVALSAAGALVCGLTAYWLL